MREQIRMGVLTKSYRADYIVVADDDSGACDWWQNLGEEYAYNWASRGVAATGPGHTIRNQFGWEFKPKNVRFAEYVHPTQSSFFEHLCRLTRTFI
jgi:hypothetical protein